MASDARKSGGETADGGRGRPQGEASEARARRKIKRSRTSSPSASRPSSSSGTASASWTTRRRAGGCSPSGRTFLFAALWWLLYPSWPVPTTYFPGLLGYDQRAAVEAGPDHGRGGAGAAGAGGRHGPRGADHGRPGAVELCPGRRADGFQRELRPVPRARRRRAGLLPDAGRRRVAVGRPTRRHRAHDHPRHSQRRRPGPRLADAAVRRRPDPHPRADRRRRRRTCCSLAGQHDADAEAAARGQPVFAENCAACHGESGAGMPRDGCPGCRTRSGSTAPRTSDRWPRSRTRATA